MKRLQQKCFIVSTGFHLLLGLIFLTSSGFLTSNTQKPPDSMPILDFIPLKTTDDMVSGGGERNVKSAPMAIPRPTPPPPPAPVVKEDKQPDPEPPTKEPVEPIKQSNPDDFPLEPVKATKKHKIEITTTKVSRKRDNQAEKKAAQELADRLEQQRQADNRRHIARQLDEMADNVPVGNGLSGGTSIKLEGPGGGGVPYANFLQAVKSVYQRAWILPDGAVDEEATTVASVTIARDGTVVSSRILRSSGDRTVDRSVQATLDRVRFAAPLPESSQEEQRTVTINFNIRAKRAIG